MFHLNPTGKYLLLCLHFPSQKYRFLSEILLYIILFSPVILSLFAWFFYLVNQNHLYDHLLKDFLECHFQALVGPKHSDQSHFNYMWLSRDVEVLLYCEIFKILGIFLEIQASLLLLKFLLSLKHRYV